MKEDSYEEGRFTTKSHGLGTVTEAMVRARASEIAVINGRAADNVLESDLQEARRELTSESPAAPQRTAADLVPEEDRWDPVGGSTGSRAPTVPAPDEQTFAEKLVNEGVEDAEHDQMLKATKEALRRDTEGDSVFKTRTE